MQSKNKRAPTAAERRHIAKVAELPCSLCDRPGPSEVHEIKQGQWFTSVALCPDCHRSSIGLHGTKAMMRIKKLDELDLLNITVGRVVA